MATGPPDYLSYMLRLWRAHERGVSVWRASLQSPQTGKRVSFATLDELFAFLREQTGVATAQEDTGPGESPDRSKDLAGSFRCVGWPCEQGLGILGTARREKKGDHPMSLEELKAKIRWAGEEAWLQGNLDALDEVYAADYVWHRPPFPDTSGIEAVKESIEGMRSAYSDIQIVYEEMVGEGSRIAYRYSMRARHTGVTPTMPIPPTGKEVTLVGCVVVNVADGKIVEEFEYSDYLGFLQQLGVVPPLG